MEIARNNLLVNPSVTVNLNRERLSEPDSLLSMTYDASLKYSIPNYRIHDSEQIVTVSSDGNAIVTDGTNNIATGAMVGTVQVNLPRISYEATGKDERFLQGVQNAVDEAIKALEIRRQAVQERMKEGLLPLFSWETDGRTYYGSRPMAEIGLLGLNEAVRHHTKKDVDAKDSLAFLKKIIEAARRAISESDNPKLRIRVGLHPSPEASSRLASIDAEKYGFSTIVYQGSKRHPYYTDVPLIPLTQKMPLSSRAYLEGEAQKLLDGGTTFPLLMGEKAEKEGLARASQVLADSGVKHFTFSKMLSRCQFCYQVNTGVHARCANCGSDKLTFVAKYALVNNTCTGNVMSGGLAVTAPTGPRTILYNGQTVRSTLLQPWTGFIWNLNDKWYTHGFSSIIIPTDSDDVSLAATDFGIGWRLYQSSFLPPRARSRTASKALRPAVTITSPNPSIRVN